jgi:CIC family chloride channel protein
MLELGRRHNARLSGERIVAALVGGLIGWGINVAFHLNLIRLIVPKEPPSDLAHALITAVFIGALSGGITSVAGWTV